MSTFIKLPKWLTRGNNIDPQCELAIVPKAGVYLYLTRTDNGEQVDLCAEGNGEPGAADRIVAYARNNRRKYILAEIESALGDDWQRGRLGIPALPTADAEG